MPGSHRSFTLYLLTIFYEKLYNDALTILSKRLVSESWNVCGFSLDPQEAGLEIQRLCEGHSRLFDIHLFTSQWNPASLETNRGHACLTLRGAHSEGALLD